MGNLLINSGLTIICALSCYSIFLWVILIYRPDMSVENCVNDSSCKFDRIQPVIQFPRTVNDLQEMVSVLQQYKENHFTYLVLLFSAAYVYKQTFAIPGSALMNVLGGALLGVWVAAPAVCILTAVGASCCYLLSKNSIAPLLLQWKPDRVAWLREQMNQDTSEILLFLISLRIFPGTPNWFLNMAAPVAGVPLHLFFGSVLLGLAPYNTVCVLAGSSVSQLKSISDLFSRTTFICFLFIALATYGCSKLAAKLKDYNKDIVKTS